MNSEVRSKVEGSRRIRFDDEGHAIFPSQAEVMAMAESVLAGLAEMAEIPDDPPGSDIEFMKAIDANRPERPLFEKYY